MSGPNQDGSSQPGWNPQQGPADGPQPAHPGSPQPFAGGHPQGPPQPQGSPQPFHSPSPWQRPGTAGPQGAPVQGSMQGQQGRPGPQYPQGPGQPNQQRGQQPPPGWGQPNQPQQSQWGQQPPNQPPPSQWGQQPPGPPQPKKKTGLIVGLVVGVVVLALIGVGGWFLFSKAKAAAELAEADERAVASAEAAIREIGEVDLDAEPRIEKAEKRYEAVRDEARDQVSNAATLDMARDNFELQIERLAAVQKEVDTWFGAPDCATSYALAEKVETLNQSQLDRLEGGQDVLDAARLCAEEEQAAEDEKEAAEDKRRKNLVKVSNYWFTDTGEKPAEGCTFQVTPELTNLSTTETFTKIVINVGFYNADGSTAVDMAGNTQQEMVLTGSVAPGALFRQDSIKVNYDCGIETVRIDTIALTYASGGTDEIYGNEIQYGAQWSS